LAVVLLGNIPLSLISADSGKLTTIVASVSLVLIFLFLPETQYPRVSKAQAPPQVESSDSEYQSDPPKESLPIEEAVPAGLPVKKSYLQGLKPWSGINPNGEKANFLSLFLRSWPLILYPAVAYSTFVFGVAVSCMIALFTTVAIVFQSPPYNFSPGIQSLVFLAMLTGGLIGAFVGGYGSDVVIKYRTTKNNGIFEPENRLILLILPVFIVPAGVLMYVPFLFLILAFLSFFVFVILTCLDVSNSDVGTDFVVQI
jgi:hypothetical protein